MERRLLSGIVRRLEGRHNRRAENGNAGVRMEPPPTLEPSIERAAEKLDQEASAIRNVMNVEASTPIAVAANLPEPEPMPRGSVRLTRCSPNTCMSCGSRLAARNSLTMSEAASRHEQAEAPENAQASLCHCQKDRH